MEISEVLNRVKVYIVAGQETWERKDKVVNVDGYKWFGKPRIDQNSRKGEGGVGFLVRECIAEEVEIIRDVRYKESVWMKVRGGRGKEALYLCCVYMPTEGQAGFRAKRSCVDNIYVLSELVQGRLREGKKTF